MINNHYGRRQKRHRVTNETLDIRLCRIELIPQYDNNGMTTFNFGLMQYQSRV